jgi:hypothetical protein
MERLRGKEYPHRTDDQEAENKSVLRDNKARYRLRLALRAISNSTHEWFGF